MTENSGATLEVSTLAVEPETPKKALSWILPVVAVCLSLGSLIYFGATNLMRMVIWADIGVIFLLLPAAGLVLGIVYLGQGRKKINIVGIILSIIAIASPIAAALYDIIVYMSRRNSEFPFM